ncbi:MAG: DedA family protein [Candidatus Zixiibacteriota bacterium]|nr:MAG: DedA family protein [candidate division Zixibacteria bacterium]
MSFDQILEIIRSQNEFIIYALLLLSAFIENVFPPFPGDATVLAGAFIAGKGNIGYLGVLTSVTIGGVAGGMILYFLGRSKGRDYFIHSKYKYFGKSNLLKVESLFQKYGTAVLAFSRFFAGVRSAISIAAGLGNVRFSRMFILTIFSNLLWCGMLIGLMIYTKSNWRAILDLVKNYHMVLFALIALVIVVWAVMKLWMKRRK